MSFSNCWKTLMASQRWQPFYDLAAYLNSWTKWSCFPPAMFSAFYCPYLENVLGTGGMLYLKAASKIGVSLIFSVTFGTDPCWEDWC